MRIYLRLTHRAIGLFLATMAPTALGGVEGFATVDANLTGGAGGPVVYARTGTEIHQAICERPSRESPVIIHVEGTINHGNTSKVSGSCSTADDRISIRGVSNITLVGVGNGALFDQLGIHIHSSSNIILQNLHVRNVKKTGWPLSNGGDAIGIESRSHHLWVDHCTLEASGGEAQGFDGLIDIKNNSKYITLSYSILRNSGRGGLVGSSDTDTNNGPITFHHNHYQNIDTRTPLLRAATAHAYNNFYERINGSGINSRLGAQIKVENNYFSSNSKDPLGTFYTYEMGSWELSGNYWQPGISWSSWANQRYPAGPNLQSTTWVNIPYSYHLDNSSCVPNIVRRTAGANKGMQESNGSCW